MCAQDAFASPLTFSGGAADTMALGLLEAVFQSPRGQLVGSLEQALPLRPAWLNFNRARLRLERSLPVGAGVSAHACLRGAAPAVCCALGGRRCVCTAWAAPSLGGLAHNCVLVQISPHESSHGVCYPQKTA